MDSEEADCEIKRLIDLGTEFTKTLLPFIKERSPNENLHGVCAVGASAATSLMTSSFVSLVKVGGPKLAEQWLSAVLADFSEGIKEELEKEGYPIDLTIEIVSRRRDDEG